MQKFEQLLLSVPYDENKPDKFRVEVIAKCFPPDGDNDGDTFVSLISAGLHTMIEERHLGQIIEALIEAKELFRKTERQITTFPGTLDGAIDP